MENITIHFYYSPLAHPHTHTSSIGLMGVRSSDRQENNLRNQWNNGHRKEKPVLLTWAGCPSFLRGTHWVYSGRYETMVHNRSAEKNIISRDGKIQLTLSFHARTGGDDLEVYIGTYMTSSVIRLNRFINS